MNEDIKGNTETSRELYGDNKYNPLEEELLFRPLTRALAQKLKGSSIHPDHLSLIGFLLTITLAVLIGTSATSLGVIVVLCFLCLFFDKLDGDLARAKGIAGRKGQYIDGYLDAIGEVVLVIGIAVAVNPPLIFAMLASAAPVIFNYHSVSAPFYLDILPSPHSITKRKSLWDHIRDAFSYGRAKFFLLIMLLVICNSLSLIFIIVPLLMLYTSLFFVKNIFIRKLTKR